MSDYNYIMTQNGELYHYGVLGMKWGVRRASKRLSKATTDEARGKAIASLEKHRSKANAQISALKKQQPKLQEKMDRNIVKNETKAAKLNVKATKKMKKSYGRFTSEKKSQKLQFEAKKLEVRAASLTAKSNQAKAKVMANKTMQEAFSRGINDIDRILADKGKAYLRAG